MIGTSVEQIVDRCEAEFERLKAHRPALLSRIKRAEDILITHLSCKQAGIIKPRVRGGELAGYLVKGSGGAVYRVDTGTFSCSCPDYHRSNLKGCKHGIVCYALASAFGGRAFRPCPVGETPPARQAGRRCETGPKITRHSEAAGSFEHVGNVAARVLEGIADEAAAPGEAETDSCYGETTCSRCWAKPGLTYDGQVGEWVACERCGGSGRVLTFLYERAERHLAECAGCGERYPHRELIEVTEEHESLTWFVGDKLCRGEAGCAGAHGVL